MANPIPVLHNLRLVQLSVGSVPISGYGQEGGIEFEYGAPRVETAVGADGHPFVSVNANDSLTCRITIGQGTRADALLFGLYRAQRTAMNTLGRIPPLPFLMVTPAGDKVDDPYTVFAELPPPNQARTIGERVWVLWLPSAGSRVVLGGAALL